MASYNSQVHATACQHDQLTGLHCECASLEDDNLFCLVHQQHKVSRQISGLCHLHLEYHVHFWNMRSPSSMKSLKIYEQLQTEMYSSYWDWEIAMQCGLVGDNRYLRGKPHSQSWCYFQWSTSHFVKPLSLITSTLLLMINSISAILPNGPQAWHAFSLARVGGSLWQELVH